MLVFNDWHISNIEILCAPYAFSSWLHRTPLCIIAYDCYTSSTTVRHEPSSHKPFDSSLRIPAYRTSAHPRLSFERRLPLLKPFNQIELCKNASPLYGLSTSTVRRFDLPARAIAPPLRHAEWNVHILHIPLLPLIRILKSIATNLHPL